MNASLTINVSFRLNGEAPSRASARLSNAAAFLAAHGLLTGDGPAEVDTWDSEVQILEAEQRPGVVPALPTVYEVSTAAGPVQWTLVPDLTDRWGLLNYAKAMAKQPYLDRLQSDPELLRRMVEQMWDEISFVVAKDRQLGILFEIDFQTAEADSPNGKPSGQYRPEAEVTRYVLAKLEALTLEFPAVEFGVPQPQDTALGRVCLWAFVPDDRFTPGERQALGLRLLEL